MTRFWLLVAALAVCLFTHSARAQTPVLQRVAAQEAQLILRAWDASSSYKADRVSCGAYSLTEFMCELRAPTVPGRLKCLGMIIYIDGHQYDHWWMVCRGTFAFTRANVA